MVSSPQKAGRDATLIERARSGRFKGRPSTNGSGQAAFRHVKFNLRSRREEADLPLTLPEPVTDRLGHPPLKLVVCQIRFEETPAVAEGRTGLAFFNSLGGTAGPYPQFSDFRGEQLDITVAPGSPIAAQRTPLTGWKCVSEDQNWTVYLLPNSVSLETKAYTTWTDDFEARVRSILDAVVQQVNPSVQMRLGLRYVDLLTQSGAKAPKDWQGWIVDTFLGPALHPQLGPSVIAAQQQVELDADNGTRCTLRHGTVLDAATGSPAYLLDWDVHADAPVAFDREAILESLLGFNRLAIRLFQVAITPEMLQDLR
jgi:uncharacterized protein (TIGR04255 family)